MVLIFIYTFIHLPFLLPFPFVTLHSLRRSVGTWNYYQLLRLCHDYVITILSPTFYPSFVSFVCLRAHQVQTKYTVVLLSSLLSSVATQHSSVPTTLISTQTNLPVAGSLQLYLGTQIDTPPSPHGHYYCQVHRNGPYYCQVYRHSLRALSHCRQPPKSLISSPSLI